MQYYMVLLSSKRGFITLHVSYSNREPTATIDVEYGNEAADELGRISFDVPYENILETAETLHALRLETDEKARTFQPNVHTDQQ